MKSSRSRRASLRKSSRGSRRKSPKQSSSSRSLHSIDYYLTKNYQVTFQLTAQLWDSSKAPTTHKTIPYDFKSHSKEILKIVKNTLPVSGSKIKYVNDAKSEISFQVNASDLFYFNIMIDSAPKKKMTIQEFWRKYVFDPFIEAGPDTWMEGNIQLPSDINNQDEDKWVELGFKFVCAKIL